MATVTKRRGSPYYQAYFSINGQRFRYSTGLSNRREAQKAADAEKDRLLEELRNSGGVRLMEAAESFFRVKDLAAATVSAYEGNLAQVLHTLGDVVLANVSVDDIVNYINIRRSDGAKVVIRRELAFLSSLFQFSMSMDPRVKINPVKMVDKSSLPNGEERDNYVTPADFEKLIAACNLELHKVMITVAVDTGMRKGELLRLHERNVDFEQGIITLKRTQTKTKRGRTIPLSDRAAQGLKRLRDQNVARALSHKRPHSAAWSGYFFENPKTGKPITTISTAWRGICRRAGFEDLHFHDLRHTFATWGLASGVSQVTLMSITGHRSVASFKRYAHATAEAQKAAVEKMAAFHTSSTQTDDNSSTQL